MKFSSVNWLAVIVCVVLNVVVGFLWYHPKVFFKAWLEGIGKGENEQTDPNLMLYIWTILVAFIEGVFVALLVSTMGNSTLATGLMAGFMIWLGFVATTNLVNNLFAGRGFKVWAIKAGNHLVYLLITGAILSVWR